jgi:Fe-S-cluster containining protein
VSDVIPPFPCTSCGACCRRLGRVLELREINTLLNPVLGEALAAFPYAARPDGSCEKLEGNLCSVYETRPDLCRVEVMRERHQFSRAIHYFVAAESCNAMQEEDGMDPSYRVALPEELPDGWRL